MVRRIIMTKFLGDWNNLEDMLCEFGYAVHRMKLSIDDNINILLAFYSTESYEGECFILFEKEYEDGA